MTSTLIKRIVTKKTGILFLHKSRFYLCCKSGKLLNSSLFAFRQPLNINYSILGAKYDKRKGEISFYQDCKLIGIGFHGEEFKNLELYPAVVLCHSGTEIEIINENQ